MSSVVDQLAIDIQDSKVFTYKDIDNFQRRIYDLKAHNLDRSSIYKNLDRMQDYINYQHAKLDSDRVKMLSRLLFFTVPLIVLSSFMGMNMSSVLSALSLPSSYCRKFLYLYIMVAFLMFVFISVVGV